MKRTCAALNRRTEPTMNNPRTDKNARKAWYQAYRAASPAKKKEMRAALTRSRAAHDRAWAYEFRRTAPQGADIYK
jgi:hypothetical protein